MMNVRPFSGADALRIVVIHGQAAEGLQIIKLSFPTYIILCHNIIADISSALALAGQEPYEIQFPIICIAFTAVEIKKGIDK